MERVVHVIEGNTYKTMTTGMTVYYGVCGTCKSWCKRKCTDASSSFNGKTTDYTDRCNNYSSDETS